MTEEEWGSCCELRLMLQFLMGKWSARKYQLFGVACCRQHWELFCKKPCRQAVNYAEGFADGIGTEEELKALAVAPLSIARISVEVAIRAADAARDAAWCPFRPEYLWSGALSAANHVLAAASASRGVAAEVNDAHPNRVGQFALLHDIAWSPFRVIIMQPDWQTSTVIALARQMYASRDFSAMPILADALQDAGCENADILGHCRGPGPHVRGCWVVDLILGKE
jgi:hypothetical protein